MPEIPEEWRMYASIQSKLDGRNTVDSTTWGLEAGLNALLDGRSSPENVRTTIASAARRSRYAEELLAKYMRIDSFFDGVAQLEARSALAVIERRMSLTDVSALKAGALGSRMRGADRTRLSRARAMIRLLVA